MAGQVNRNAIEFFDFKIVHKTIDGARRCDPGYPASLDLMHFLGTDGLAMLLSWLSIGPIKGGGRPSIAVTDLDEFVDFVRRVQTPYYEEARPRFGDGKTLDWLSDANEYSPYRPDTLRKIAEDKLCR
jgi:hypothetical protein